ncbi:MAG: rhomboid family intramembrane serine protease [Bacteroidales bacterium]|nr:rhomboid family intramembrane serine protease [Bacteroidales bacterium]
MTITILIIIGTVIVSIAAFQKRELHEKLMFDPYSIVINKTWYRFFSYALVHADWGHLLINMFVLYSFGTNVEYLFSYFFGGKAVLYFLLLYVGGVFVSVIPSFEKNKHNPYYVAVGASGAVSAVLFSSILMYPQGEIIFLLLPIPIPAYIFGILYLVYSWYMAKRGRDNIGHDVHFWGAIFGFAFTILLKPQLFLSFIHEITSFLR